MFLKDEMLVGHVFFMVIRKSIEWTKDIIANFNVKTTGKRKGTLTLFVTEQTSVNFYQMFFDDLASQ